MPDIPSALAVALQGRYTLERELGRGGMATVYLAQDLKHRRPVALKVLDVEIGATLGPERFEREIHLAARLTHPHIVPVFDSGDTAGRLWYAMPFIAGEALRARLDREGKLPLADALRIAREVAEALDYAHRQGVVHRDVKPENILLADGQALLADFGIARATAGTVAGQALTATGFTLGTPAYMSPEQAGGAVNVDGRSDVYSLGCVLYEMLAGSALFTGATPQAVIASRFKGPPPRIGTVRPEVPELIGVTLDQALAFEPGDRYQTAGAFAQALLAAGPTPAGSRTGVLATVSRWQTSRRNAALLALAVVLALGTALGLGWRLHAGSVAGVAGPTRLAVLPFENMGDTADAYFADGMTDAVRDRLTAIPGLEVIATTSSGTYRQSAKPMRQIGQELGVRYLVVGKVRWAKAAGGSRVQVRPELVEATTGAERWGEPFDAGLTDVFQVQGDIAARVANALGVALGGAARAALATQPTQNLAAYDAFLRGDRILIVEGKVDTPSLKQAVAAYREAVRLDSTFALAWARLARAAAVAAATDSELAEARALSARSLALAPNLAEAQLARAFVLRNVDGDPRGALEPLERARQLEPQNADVLSFLAAMLVGVNRGDEAILRYAEAWRLDPRSAVVARRYANSLLELGRLEAADSLAIAGLRLAPDNADLIRTLVVARVERGDTARARVALMAALTTNEFRQLVPPLSGYVWVLPDSLKQRALALPAQAYGEDPVDGYLVLNDLNWNEGQYDRAHAYADSARRLLEARQAAHRHDASFHYLLAQVEARAGRHDAAFAELSRGLALVKTYDAADIIPYRASLDLYSGDLAGAVAELDSLLKQPIRQAGYTVAALRVDPTYRPLRGRPDFERMLATHR